MAKIIPILKNQYVFEPEVTHAMSTAFEEACRALNLPDAAAYERETIAMRVIEWARRGLRDPVQLREQVLRDGGVA
jgi:hypothetical protein